MRLLRNNSKLQQPTVARKSDSTDEQQRPRSAFAEKANWLCMRCQGADKRRIALRAYLVFFEKEPSRAKGLFHHHSACRSERTIAETSWHLLRGSELKLKVPKPLVFMVTSCWRREIPLKQPSKRQLGEKALKRGTGRGVPVTAELQQVQICLLSCYRTLCLFSPTGR